MYMRLTGMSSPLWDNIKIVLNFAERFSNEDKYYMIGTWLRN